MNTTRSPIYSALLAALLLGGALTASAAENAGGQPNPTAAPTHTIPVQPAPSNLTIKEKSKPQAQPVGIEDEKKIKPSGFQQIGGRGCPPGQWDRNAKCCIGKPPAHFRCGHNERMVDLDPSPKVCWRCEIPMD